MKLYTIGELDGAKLMLRDKTDLWGYIQNNIYEPQETNLLKKIIKPTDICIDIGANIGYYTILLSKLGKWVHAFEPEPSNYKILEKNVALNNITNVTLDNRAVTNSEIPTKLYLCHDSHGMHRIFSSRLCSTQFINVPSTAIDYVLPIADFVKIDTEGSEFGVLKGMVNLIQRCSPTLLLEWHPPTIEEYGANPEEQYHFLRTMGYKVYLVPDTENPITYADLDKATRDESGGRNILCK
jgi:FkbM family methyltransferase